MWSIPDIADAVEAGLRQRARELDEEQAVYGLDAMDELGLHPVIQQALRQAGWGVWPEQRYPLDQVRPKRSEGKRCDVVLTAEPGLALRDPLAEGTLFASCQTAEVGSAFWLEIKSVGQYEIGGPFRRYSAELLAPVAEDVRKLCGDEYIEQGGLLLVLFTESRSVAEHDLTAWHSRCVALGYTVAPGVIRGFKITERIGNQWCALAVFGIGWRGG